MNKALNEIAACRSSSSSSSSKCSDKKDGIFGQKNIFLWVLIFVIFCSCNGSFGCGENLYGACCPGRCTRRRRRGAGVGSGWIWILLALLFLGKGNNRGNTNTNIINLDTDDIGDSDDFV